MLNDNISFTTKKEHSHNFFEIHIIKNGYQIYKTENNSFRIDSGQYLIIPPHLKHQIIESKSDTVKYSLTFCIGDYSNFFNEAPDKLECITGNSEEFARNIEFIDGIKLKNPQFSNEIIAGRIFEIIIGLFSSFELNTENTDISEENFDQRISLAKEFIKDNIRLQLTVSDISAYCHLSNKQLTRLFKQYEGMTPLSYIQKKRCEYIEKLLKDKKYSIKEISEIMNFNNEFYFNTYFKKYSGLPPDAFRKMHTFSKQ